MARSVSHESSQWNTAAHTNRVGVVQPQLKTNIPETKVDDELDNRAIKPLPSVPAPMPQQTRGTRDPWLPDLEQKKYYSDEFIKLSQNPSGWIAGEKAREFFFKSKLPTVELR